MTIDHVPVEAGHILMFARALGDENPVYTDPSSPQATAFGGVLAPPTFTFAGSQFDPDEPMRPRPGAPWFGSASEPGVAEVTPPNAFTPSSTSSTTDRSWPAPCSRPASAPARHG